MSIFNNLTKVTLSNFVLNKKQFIYSATFLIWIVVCVLIIVQDFIYSSIKNIPFYWSEVLLFKIYWLLFIPFSFTTFYLSRSLPITKQNLYNSIPAHSLLSVVLSFSQLILFALLVSGISKVFSHYPFNTLNVFRKALAKDFYLSILVYWALLFIYHNYFLRQKEKNRFDNYFKKQNDFLKFIHVRNGRDIIPIDVNEIDWIGKDEKYIVIHYKKKKYLKNQNLTKTAKSLNPKLFARIHRSTIVNIKKVNKVTSRSNGDYDVLMKDGTLLRLSRNYRKSAQGILF